MSNGQNKSNQIAQPTAQPRPPFTPPAQTPQQQRPPLAISFKRIVLFTGPDVNPTITLGTDIINIEPSDENNCVVNLSNGDLVTITAPAIDVFLIASVHIEQGHDIIRMTSDVVASQEFIEDAKNVRKDRFPSVKVMKKRFDEMQAADAADPTIVTDVSGEIPGA